MKIMFKLREDNAKEIFCYSKRKRLDIRDTQLGITITLLHWRVATFPSCIDVWVI